MTNPEGSFIWYELMTTDADAATKFYEAVVGWTIGARGDQPDGEMDYRMIVRSDGGMAGGLLNLSGEMTSHGARPCWLGYLSVSNVDQSVEAIIADGGQLRKPAADMPGVGRIALVTDPQGAAFYVMTPAPPPGMESMDSDVFSVDQPQHIRWNELATSDPDAASSFYTRHFGWQQEGQMDMGGMGKYLFIQHCGVGIGAIMAKMPQMPMSAWNYYIGVDDIDRAVAAVQAGGGQIMHGPMEIPGGEFSANGLDPQGAAFGIVGPKRN